MRASSRGKRSGSAKCCNTQLSLFDNSVIEHVAANVTALCLNPPAESKRHKMNLRQAKGLEIAHKSEITRLEIYGSFHHNQVPRNTPLI